jgi:organic hydroperoxide reductase OsmC/OhrA
VTSPGLPEIDTSPPVQFDGPGGVWSPETLLCASVADCVILTFRAIAHASRLEWTELRCRVEGVLDRVDGIARFTGFTTYATLKLTHEAETAKARSLLEKAEHQCLIANSLSGKRALVAEVVQDGIG